MNRLLLDKIVEAVLYEGFILYPYRPSSKKNQQRFTFGRVYPQSYSVAQKGAEPFVMQTECLVRTLTRPSTLEVGVRFLHPTNREIALLPAPVMALPEKIESFRIVPELNVSGILYQTWQEAVEREVTASSMLQGSPVNHSVSFSFPYSNASEPIRDEDGQVVAAIMRSRQSLDGTIEIAAEPLDSKVWKLAVRVLNRSSIAAKALDDSDAVVMSTFASTHTILHVDGGEFISLTDPPAEYARAAEACKNIGTWPVLVGDEEKCERDTMLSSPIILYDYPKIAPESAGNLFDGTEIDEILTLRIKTMTDEEKFEMRSVDECARQVLERADNMTGEQFLKMHGTMRSVSPPEEDFFNPTTRLESIVVNGVSFRTGHRVRIRPKGRADAMDMILDGKVAVIEAVEQDVEDRVHLALVLEDDPGKDLGMLRQSGHRFFYTTDEVEPITDAE